MANASTNVTFDEWVKRFDKSSTKTIIELAAASNLMLKTSNVAPGNESDGNTTTVRTSYPTGSWTSAYEGVASEASHTREVFDAAGYLEGYSIIAKRYVHRSPDRKAARMQEEKAFIIGFSEEVEETFFYGDRTLDPKEFTGLDKRYDSTTAETGGQITLAKEAGGTDYTDMWLCMWGAGGVSLFFGMNNTGGLEIDDKGLIPWSLDGGANHQECYVSHYQWNVGLKVEDYRAVSRLANIDVSDIRDGTKANLHEEMVKMWYKIPSTLMSSLRPAIYCNTDVLQALTIEAQGKSNLSLTWGDWEGKPVLSFYGIPIFRTDKITNTNGQIS